MRAFAISYVADFYMGPKERRVLDHVELGAERYFCSSIQVNSQNYST